MAKSKSIPAIPAGRPSSPAPSVAESETPMIRLFRPVDWLTFGVVTLVMFATYLLTISPQLTLEDSGELAVGSMYAGVPHPPGYPVWTLYSWFFTVILPFSNMAWRVSVSSAFAGALSVGIIGMLVSRGSSLIVEGIAEFRSIERKWENPLCLISGLVAGLLLGFNGFIWSQSVIVEVYTLAVLTFAGVLVCLFRWTYSPGRLRYLYAAFFLFGLCFCNHQTLIVAAMGIEVVIAMGDRKLGRDFFLANTLVWLLGLLGHFTGLLGTFRSNEALLTIFNLVGIGSAIGTGYLAYHTRGLGNRLHIVLLSGLVFGIGAAFYFYMPVASMTNPPMNWGYPRTWEGFIHAFTRGQYEKTTPTSDPFLLIRQMFMYAEGAQEEFNWANLLIGLVPFLFLNRMQRRERGWIIGLTAVYLTLAILLMVLLNPTVDRQSRELVKVFFTASHIVITMAVGYGLSLIGALILTEYRQSRFWLLVGAAVACAFNLYEVLYTFNETVFTILRTATLLSLAISTVFLLLVILQREKAALMPFLVLFAIIPSDSALSHWADNEQLGHYFGFWYGHDMFEPGMDTPAAPAPKDKSGKPLYPSMARDAVLFGGTDPGRFCPTYMAFAESFTPPEDRTNPKFDRRDVYVITQNALADNTYLDYIRAHYNRSAQVDPPFFYGMLNDAKSIARGRTNTLATLAAPLDERLTGLGARFEKKRRAGSSLFVPSSFKDLNGFRSRIQSASDPVSQFLKNKLGQASNAGERELSDALNQLLEGPSIFTADRFKGVTLTSHLQQFVAQDPPTFNRIRLNRLLLEAAYPDLIAVSEAGLYPDLEIITPSIRDSSNCFQEYTEDAARRHQLKQLEPGEIVNVLPDGRVSVSGQVAVMAINGLLTKVIFDANPNHEFYVEESFPLKWMYPHLVPAGIIMKIERKPQESLSEEVIARDHEYWSQYSDRLIGNWIRYETPVSEVVDFVKRTYITRDLRGFKGDPKFVRDRNAQKAFSKLRNAIGKTIYTWRAQNYSKTPEEQAMYLREAEFALKQAFAYCPYSPETVFNYVSLLAGMGLYEEAAAVARTCYEFDPDNSGVQGLVQQVEELRKARPPAAYNPRGMQDFEKKFRSQPTNVDLGFQLASAYFQANRSNDAMGVLEQLLTNEASDTRTLVSLAEAFRQVGLVEKMEQALERYAKKSPTSPEAWFDLAAVQAALGKTEGAQRNLSMAISLSDTRLQADPKARNLRDLYASDARFDAIRKNLRLPTR
ncbi:MAG: protein O-mannosyl-transferase family [Limisphaerales bacterium]